MKAMSLGKTEFIFESKQKINDVSLTGVKLTLKTAIIAKCPIV